MANGASIPSWLNINPLAPVPLFLQGYGQGASVGTSRRSGEQQAAQFELSQIAAAESRRIQEKQNELREAEFTANLRLKEAEARREIAKETREAAAAARQLSAQQRAQQGMASGKYPTWAHAYADNPDAIRPGVGSVVGAMNRMNQANAQSFWVPEGGFSSPGDVPFNFQGDPSELVGLTGVPAHRMPETGVGRLQFVPRQASDEPKRHPLQNKIDTLKAEYEAAKLADDVSANDLKMMEAQIKELERIVSGKPVEAAKKRFAYDPTTRSLKLVP